MQNQISIPNFDFKKPITFLLTLFSVILIALLGGIFSGTISLERYSLIAIALFINIWISGMFLALDRSLYIKFQRKNKIWTMRTNDDYSDYEESSLIIFIATLFITIFITIAVIGYTAVKL